MGVRVFTSSVGGRQDPPCPSGRLPPKGSRHATAPEELRGRVFPSNTRDRSRWRRDRVGVLGLHQVTACPGLQGAVGVDVSSNWDRAPIWICGCPCVSRAISSGPLAAAGFTAAPGLAEGCAGGVLRAAGWRAALLRLPERRAGNLCRLRWHGARVWIC